MVKMATIGSRESNVERGICRHYIRTTMGMLSHTSGFRQQNITMRIFSTRFRLLFLLSSIIRKYHTIIKS